MTSTLERTVAAVPLHQPTATQKLQADVGVLDDPYRLVDLRLQRITDGAGGILLSRNRIYLYKVVEGSKRYVEEI